MIDLLEIEIRRPKMDRWRNSLHCVWLISDLAVLFRMKVRLLTWITYLNHSKGKHDNIQVEVVFPTPGVPNAQTRCVSVASITFHQKSSVMLWSKNRYNRPMPYHSLSLWVRSGRFPAYLWISKHSDTYTNHYTDWNPRPWHIQRWRRISHFYI